MANSISFLSASLQAVNTIRLTYSAFPLTASSYGINDATNIANYIIIGPGAGPFLVQTVIDHPEQVDLVFQSTILPGVWSVTSSNIQTWDGLVCPNRTISLPISQQLLVSAISQGAVNDGAESFIRKHIGRAFKGLGWNAIVCALGVSDRYNWDNSRLAFNQLWRSTASGVYLDRRGADFAIRRPPSVGMTDDSFRRLTIKSAANKLTPESLLEVLEIYYGSAAVRAMCSTTGTSPFPLVDGYDLQLLIDGKQLVGVTFNATDFANIAQAAAIEVAASITTACTFAGTKAYAYSYTDPTTGSSSVNVVSSSLGLGSSVVVTGGHAQSILGFPALVTGTGIVTPSTAFAWTISIPQTGTARFTQTAGPALNLSLVQAGDYFNFYSTGYNAANKGSFTIANVYYGGVASQYIDVTNPNAVAEAIGAGQACDALIFRPIKNTVYLSVAPVLLSQNGVGFDVQLPATSQAVSRTKNSGAYFQPVSTLAISSIVRTIDGTVTVTTSAPHGLSVGQQLIIDGINVTSTAPAINAGTASTTSSSLSTVSSTLTAATWTVRTGPSLAAIPNGMLLFGGQNAAGNILFADSYRYIFGAGVAAADGSIAYPYTSPATPSCPTAMTASSINAITGTSKLVIGAGQTATSGVERFFNGYYVYDYVANTWTVGGTYNVQRGYASAAYLSASNKLIVAGGKLDNTGAPGAGTISNAIDVINAASLTGLATAGGTLNVGRYGAVIVPVLNGTRALVVGGSPTSAFYGVATPTSLTELIDQTGNVVATANMAVARTDPALVTLPDGRILAINDQAGPVTTACELYDPVTNRWAMTSPTLIAHSSFSYFYHPAKNYVYVVSYISNQSSEYYNVATGEWSLAPWIRAGGIAAPRVGANSAFSINNDALAFAYGNNTATSNVSEVTIVNTDVYSAGKVNGRTAGITAVPTTTTLQFKTEATIYSSGTGGTISIATAGPSIVPGPYVYDTKGGAPVTAIETTTSAVILSGSSYQSIAVANASTFPNSTGYLVFAFGTTGAVYPVKYFGIQGNTLLLDASLVFKSAVPVGSKVTLLSQIAPWVPASPQSVGSFYLTASSSGRVSATKAVNDNSAAGIKVNISVKYPGDRGLGGEGQATHGLPKLTDAVSVWGSDNVDQDLATARIT